MPTKFASLIGAFALLAGASMSFANEGGHAGWQREANNEVANLPSLQRGARNFMSYCSGCHSIKYMRYSRVAEDLKISDKLRDEMLVRPGEKFSDYIVSPMPAADAQDWFDVLLNGEHIVNVGNNNVSNTNIPAYNQMIDKAKRMPLGPARNAIWAKLDELYMKNDAGWAPFMNRQWPKFVSPHLHGLVFNGTYFELFPSMWLSQ